MGRVLRVHGEGQADGVPGRGVRILAHDQDLDVRQRLPEGAQDVRRRRQHRVPGRHFVGQEGAGRPRSPPSTPASAAAQSAAISSSSGSCASSAKPTASGRIRLQLEQGIRFKHRPILAGRPAAAGPRNAA